MVWNWTYDDRYRLLSETCTAGVSPARRTEFDWDDADNRTAMRKYKNGSLVSTTSYDPASSLNQMTGWTCGDTNAVYLYDLNGNRTNKTVTVSTGSSTSTDSTAYSYDEDNRLTGVSDINNTGKTNEYSFAYDYRTRRYSRETPTEKTLHVFDGGLSVQEYDVSQASSLPSVSTLTTESIRGEGMDGGVGGMVYSIRNGQIKCSHSNHRGDVIAKTDSLGNLSWFARYNAYGTRFHEVGATYDRQRGNTKDEETPLGLSNQGMRWLDLEHGVWLTPDPIGFGDGPNRYCYVHCNPITRFDAWGLKATASSSEIQIFVQEMQKLTEHKLVVKEHLLRNPTIEISQSANPDTSKKPKGDILVERIINSKNTVRLELTKKSSRESAAILKGFRNPKRKGTDAVVKFNQDQLGKVITKDLSTGKVAKKKTPSQVVLGHELIHADHDMRGVKLSAKKTENHIYVDQNGATQIQNISQEEMRTVGFGHNTAADVTENQIRSEQINDERESY